MTFGSIPSGVKVFLDANIFVYYFTPHAVFGPLCKPLIDRIENNDIEGIASAQVLSDAAHRLMAMEAIAVFGWPDAGIASRLKRHPAQVHTLTVYRQAIDEIALIGIQVLPTTRHLVSLAADVSRQHGLLSGDALIVATMRDHGLTQLASNDADFDRVPGLTRYAPV